jgi:hypothetical protein
LNPRYGAQRVAARQRQVCIQLPSAAKNHLDARTVARIRCEQDRAAGRNPRQRHKPSTAGGLTATRIAALLGVHRQWVYHYIYRGTLKLDRDPTTGQYLIPNTPEALALLYLLHDGLIQNIDFTTEHQDA